jgi:hypothetical protein
MLLALASDAFLIDHEVVDIHAWQIPAAAASGSNSSNNSIPVPPPQASLVASLSPQTVNAHATLRNTLPVNSSSSSM